MRSKTAPKFIKFPNFSGKGSGIDFWMHFGRFQGAPGRLRDPPGTLRDASGTPLDPSGTPLGRLWDTPGHLQDARRTLQDAPGRSKTPLGCPQTLQHRSSTAPGRSRNTPGPNCIRKSCYFMPESQKTDKLP